MPNINGLVEQMVQAAAFNRIVNDPLAQFGKKQREYKGVSLLPERFVPENRYVEEAIEYRTVMANAGTRYSPVQKRGGVITGSMEVALGHSDAGSEFTGADYDALIRLLEQAQGTQGREGGGVSRPELAAMAMLVQWADVTLSMPLQEYNEYCRWQAIVSASLTVRGDNGYVDTVAYPNPTGHRVNAAGNWSDNTYDPMADIIAVAEVLKAKGYNINRIITGTDMRSKLTLNDKMKARIGHIRVDSSGNAVNVPAARANLERLNEYFSSEALPPIELYDLQYRTATTTGYFLPRGTMVLACTTGRDQTIDRGDLEPLTITDTIGYVGVGRAAGQGTPGRVTHIQPWANKPPRIEGEAWQASLPVIQAPEAIAVISGIA